MPDLDLNFHIVAPILSLALAALVVLILDLILPRDRSRPWGFAAGLFGVLLSGWYTWDLWRTVSAGAGASGALVGFSGAFGADSFSLLLNGLFLSAALTAILLSATRREEPAGFLALILWATSGMMVMAGAGNLISIFLGLEILSLALYVTVSHGQEHAGGREAGFKYLVLGSTASAILLFGFAFLFGASGTVDLGRLGAHWMEVAQGGAGAGAVAAAFGGGDLLLRVGLLFAVIGFSFKLALVPFHVWAPDVYEGAPSPVTAFMAVGTKAAAFGALARFLLSVLPTPEGGEPATTAAPLLLPLWVIAGLSIVAGSLAAIPQQNLKRLLAYSGVANAGYLIVALPALTSAGVGAALFYLFAYACAVLGIFACITRLSGEGRDGAHLESYAGMFQRRPVLASLLALFLLSLAGIPLTGGFTGKLLILGAAARAGAWVPAGLLILGSAVSLYVYFRVIRIMWTPEAAAAAPQVAAGVDPGAAPRSGRHEAGSGGQEPLSTDAAPRLNPLAAERLAPGVLLFLAAAGTLLLGLLPQWMYRLVANLQVLPF